VSYPALYYVTTHPQLFKNSFDTEEKLRLNLHVIECECE
jgi:hypothetical protein